MPPAKVYLSDDEDYLARNLAADHGTSFSYVCRIGIRLILGLPIPSAYRPENLPPPVADAKRPRVHG